MVPRRCGVWEGAVRHGAHRESSGTCTLQNGYAAARSGVRVVYYSADKSVRGSAEYMLPGKKHICSRRGPAVMLEGPRRCLLMAVVLHDIAAGFRVWTTIRRFDFDLQVPAATQ